MLQIPVSRPIFIREVSNRMYTTSAYFLSTVTATVTMFILYPVLVTLTAFYFFDLDESSFSNMLEWMFILTLTAFSGGFWGLMFGSFMKNETAAT